MNPGPFPPIQNVRTGTVLKVFGLVLIILGVAGHLLGRVL